MSNLEELRTFDFSYLALLLVEVGTGVRHAVYPSVIAFALSLVGSNFKHEKPLTWRYTTIADISSHVSSYSTTRCPILPGLTEQMSLTNSTFDWRTITAMRVFHYGVASGHRV